MGERTVVSVQFGECNFDRRPVDPHDLDEVRPVLAPYGPDGEGYVCQKNVGILYRAFHTTKESRRETQPYVSKSGLVITWDGRLDNRQELVRKIAGELVEPTDLEIVAAAYSRWGTDCFAMLIGDWALSVWNPEDHSLVLAKDFIGIHHLYYTIEESRITWCTLLDPLVLLARRRLELDEEYIAGWLSFLPAPHLTPYTGIHAVPPSSFIRATDRSCRVVKYWELAPERIRLATDSEYEEQFRTIFAESVRRRLRSESPVLAELSGGVDSSSIVCLADFLMDRGKADAPRLDTLSYYDDSEPNWNERPYFEKVEQKRGRQGWHINVSTCSPSRDEGDDAQLAVTPASLRHSNEIVAQIASCVTSKKNRVVLSGTGGDEFTGGVPTPLPELADLLAELRLRSFCRQLKLWALSKRRPWLHLLRDVLRGFLLSGITGGSQSCRPSWICSSFGRKHEVALAGYHTRLRLFGESPSFQINLYTLNGLRRQLACVPRLYEPLYETRYPFLDRDLVEFLCGVPCEQILRPKQRRSLMRRALVRLVPNEILDRKRKAYLVRSPTKIVASEWDRLAEQTPFMLAESMGIVSQDRFAKAVEKAQAGMEIDVVSAQRTLALELWLRQLSKHNLLTLPTTHGSRATAMETRCGAHAN
jgi:asparagine synthase (glutamine-hydrolysing)